MNNQTKSRKKSYIPKRRENDDKNAVAFVKSTKSGTGPNGCVSNFQVQGKRVNHIRAVNSRFTYGVAFFV